MNTSLKIKKIGNSAGIILPKEVLSHLNAEVGETLSLVTTPRGIELSAEEPDFEAQMAAAREVMARRKRALRELAK
ncbi:AbrB/MazE/SpoVT family DNA-binding domain-containing protein [Altererythrobacter sp. CC-YST694]|uniref:AbrB/MazE/SpoVT family DNA-binding domain-containing protein n=1 Tax=Altererythrobacter sp. CC-YST694 TaxID=2755038 RepID=UPI001D009F2E|nr:AbrB/MazE/SpoVT family DNA-binding domain-containing protein [Altererythrobacter sp. CC-YST694]MCB5426188.1 AbrB/MazE/SpoVT family DNA-binding domain-containing protein [Altererythrobacter sp. CC-YST694]